MTHAQIALCQVIGKRDRKILQESEHLICSLQKGIEQILGGFLFFASRSLGKWACFGRGLGGMGGKPASQHVKIACHPSVSSLFGQRSGTLSPKVLRFLHHQEQDLHHLLSPGLVFLLGDKETIPQEVCSTDGVCTSVTIITAPPVMHSPPGKLRPDPHLLNRLLPPVAVPNIQGKQA